MELNEKFKENMKNILGTDYPKYINCLSEESKKGVRLNCNYDLSKLSEIFHHSINPIAGLDNCYYVTDDKLGNTLAHHLGLIYCQEPSSMLAAEALDVKEGESVLDLCSAPGGKAGQILSKNFSGVVVLNEVNRQRANILESNIERQGFKNAVITCIAADKLALTYPAFFDKILVDAPCSGEGMFRKDPQTTMEWNANINEFNHKRQLEILKSADKMLKRGGTLVYSTCTFSLLENEQTVLDFANKCGYEIVDLPSNIKQYVTPGIEIEKGKNLQRTGHCFPQNDFGEGQFIAKLIKKSDKNETFCEKLSKNKFSLSKNEQLIAKRTIKECINDENLPLFKVGDKLFTYKNDIPLPNEIVMLGVCVGTFSKDRLVIHHQFFKTFYGQFKNVLNLSADDEMVKKFCFGEEIDCDKNGYVVVLVNGVPLGGGKASGGKLKNYYPKGLRANLIW